MDLWQDFLTNKGKVIHKWEHYFPIYERHFAPWRGRTLTFFEIGVARGGSLPLWRRYFGPLATIVGLDIDPRCKAHEGDGVAVRIGDQSDPAFLQAVMDEFGAPDIVLDDGSHQMADIRASFDILYPRVPKNGVYMVEDLHTAYWPDFGGGLGEPGSFITFAKSLIDELNADHSRGALTPTAFTRETFAMAFYDSLVCFEKGAPLRKTAPAIGVERRGVFGLGKGKAG
jgi:cephalosporin hydroxylase